MKRRLREIIEATGQLPALPATTARLLALMDDQSAGAAQVLEVIGTDPALTANLLKLCNSAYYGLRREVGSVHEALVMLGNRTVVQLAFATSLGDVLRGPLAGYRLERDALWRHSLAVAVGAAHLAGVAGDRSLRERAFTAGLVHDIGKLVLNGPLKAKLQQLPQTGSYDALRQGERDLLGFDHAEAGQALAESWNFPAALADVIGRHHDVAAPRAGRGRADDALVTAVVVANLGASRAGFGAGSVCDDQSWQDALATLGIAPADAEAALARLPGDVGALAAAMDGRP
ncbi:MAG: HDOD domain-containing protein [bacterium]|nr:HDOD domain-containing protein [bacterium]